MGEAKRRGTFEIRKQSAPKKTSQKKFNDDKGEVIEKMIELGIYEESLKNPNWFVVSGDYIFAWKDGEYSYMYTTDKNEMARFLKLNEEYCGR